MATYNSDLITLEKQIDSIDDKIIETTKYIRLCIAKYKSPSASTHTYDTYKKLALTNLIILRQYRKVQEYLKFILDKYQRIKNINGGGGVRDFFRSGRGISKQKRSADDISKELSELYMRFDEMMNNRRTNNNNNNNNNNNSNNNNDNDNRRTNNNNNNNNNNNSNNNNDNDNRRTNNNQINDMIANLTNSINLKTDVSYAKILNLHMLIEQKHKEFIEYYERLI